MIKSNFLILYGFFGALICFIMSIIPTYIPCADKNDFIYIDLICNLNTTTNNNIGYYYQKGKGVKKDYAAAVKWYTQGALHGDATAQCSLAMCYHFGRGVKKDRRKAVKWYTKAAEQGNEMAKQALEQLQKELK
jgi:TPR repeat protein